MLEIYKAFTVDMEELRGRCSGTLSPPSLRVLKTLKQPEGSLKHGKDMKSTRRVDHPTVLHDSGKTVSDTVFPDQFCKRHNNYIG